MQNKSVQNGINAGIAFAVIIVFLALIGFTDTGALLVAKFFGQPPAASQNPSPIFLVIFMALLGMWNGAYASRPSQHNSTLSTTVTASLVAGLVAGALVTGLGLIYTALLANKIDPRASLAAVSPNAMNFFLFNLGDVGAFLHLVIMLVAGLLGGLLAYGMRHGTFRKKTGAWAAKLTTGASRNAVAHWFRRTPYAIYIIYVAAALILFFLPRVWGSYWNYIIGTVGIYIILGLGLNIIVGLAGQLVLGYVAFFAIGAYAVALLTAPAPHNLQWNFWLVLIIGVILAAFTGVLLGLPILRLRGDYLAIVTLGFGEIIRILLKSDLLTAFTGGPKGVRNVGGPTLLGRSFTSDIDFMYVIIVAVLLIIFITSRLQNSRTGRAWEAIREDEIAARANGINTFQSKLLALAIGAAFAGLGGVLFASRNQFTGPEDHVLMVSINVLALVIVGGMGSIPGIILGAFALKGLPELMRELDIYRLMFFGALLVVMMILRPEGLWPASRPRLENKSQAESAPDQSAKSIEGVQHASKP